MSTCRCAVRRAFTGAFAAVRDGQCYKIFWIFSRRLSHPPCRFRVCAPVRCAGRRVTPAARFVQIIPVFLLSALLARVSAPAALALSCWAFRRRFPSCHASLSVRNPADWLQRGATPCAARLQASAPLSALAGAGEGDRKQCPSFRTVRITIDDAPPPSCGHRSVCAAQTHAAVSGRSPVRPHAALRAYRAEGRSARKERKDVPCGTKNRGCSRRPRADFGRCPRSRGDGCISVGGNRWGRLFILFPRYYYIPIFSIIVYGVFHSVMHNLRVFFLSPAVLLRAFLLLHEIRCNSDVVPHLPICIRLYIGRSAMF